MSSPAMLQSRAGLSALRSRMSSPAMLQSRAGLSALRSGVPTPVSLQSRCSVGGLAPARSGVGKLTNRAGAGTEVWERLLDEVQSIAG